jgi:hypothetical protein
MNLSISAIMFEINKTIISNDLIKLKILLYLLIAFTGEIELNDLYGLGDMCKNGSIEINKEIQEFISSRMNLSISAIMFEINKTIISNDLIKLKILLYLLIAFTGEIELNDLYGLGDMCKNGSIEINKEIQEFISSSWMNNIIYPL